MTPDEPLLFALLRTSLHAFIMKCFHTLAPGTQYKDNWHIQAIAFELTRCANGDQRRLLITQPPRSLKSICTSVAFAAWALGHDPTLQIICVSYSQDLALELARQFRLIVNSWWYQRLFPRMRIAKDTAEHLVTTQGGGRYATSIGGTLTGIGADIVVIDDPLKAEDAQSLASRRQVIHWYRETLLTRLNDQNTGVIVLVMQRLHEEDLAGEAAQDWPTLSLPAIAIEPERIAIGAGEYHERQPGDLLHPERLPLAVLEGIESGIGSHAFSAQYQQAPLPHGGNLILRKWLRWYKEPPREFNQIVQSWDVAGSLTGDYSVCTTWGVVKNDYYLLDVWRDRATHPDLRAQVVRLAQRFEPRALLIEKAGLGLSLVDDLRANAPFGVPKPIGIQPEKDKIWRMDAVSPHFEAGQVWLPEAAGWLGVYAHELLGFPHTKHDDQADSTSQFLYWINRRRGRARGIPSAPILIQLADPTPLNFGRPQFY